MQPGLAQQVGSVSRGLQGKGMHTTQVKQLFPLDGGGYLADVPGLRTLALWDVQGEELDAYFREIAPLVPECQFNDCTHSREPGCAVRSAAESGRIDPRRYDSYLRLRFGGKLVQAEDEEIDFETLIERVCGLWGESSARVVDFRPGSWLRKDTGGNFHTANTPYAAAPDAYRDGCAAKGADGLPGRGTRGPVSLRRTFGQRESKHFRGAL